MYINIVVVEKLQLLVRLVVSWSWELPAASRRRLAEISYRYRLMEAGRVSWYVLVQQLVQPAYYSDTDIVAGAINMELCL